MDTPQPNNNQKIILFTNVQNQTIRVITEINDNKLILSTELNENNLGNKKYSSFYSFDEIKSKNKFFNSCKNLNDALNLIENLTSKNNNNLTFKNSNNQIILYIPTDIIFELNEDLKENLIDKNFMDKDKDNIEKDLSAPDLDEIEKNEITPDNNNEKNIALLLKENKIMRQKISNLENQLTLLNINFGILPEYYFNRIKEWIGGDKNKISFNLIYRLGEREKNYDRYHANVNIYGPKIFIIITENLSVFGSYGTNYYTGTKNDWVSDSKAFLFSLNLDKKYPAKKAKENYYIGKFGYLFKDITFSSFVERIGRFGKSGVYLDKYELEGDINQFLVKHFLVYKVEYI